MMTIFEILPLTITLVCISRKGRVSQLLFIQPFLIRRNSGIPYQNLATYSLSPSIQRHALFEFQCLFLNNVCRVRFM